MRITWGLIVMEKQLAGSITKYFEGSGDPRTGNTKAHIFVEILMGGDLTVDVGGNSEESVGRLE